MSKTVTRWVAALLLSLGLSSAHHHRNGREQPGLLLRSATAQMICDLQNLQRYYQEVQARLRVAGLSRPEQHSLMFEQAAYLEKMRRLAAIHPLAVPREVDAFLLAHEADPDLLTPGN